MVFLIHHIRKIVFGLAFLLWLAIYFYAKETIPSEHLQQIRLGQYYALTAVSLLYLALIASPLYSSFPDLKIKPIHIRARRAIGVSAFFFALAHARLEFFDLLGGFEGLPYLPSEYIRAIAFAATALLILSLMASTSFDWAVKKLGSNWKKLHRLVYVAATFVVIHALMLGTHFTDLSETIPKIFFAALALLLILEALRLDRYLVSRFNLRFNFGIALLTIVALIAYGTTYLRAPTEGQASSLGIHANHIKIAEEVQNQSATKLPNLPGLTGDRTKRYSVSFNQAGNVVAAGQPTELKFRIFDASNGTPVTLFKKPYQEVFHLIIVDSSLTYFNHIHPKQSGNEFSITTTFPENSTYRLYTEFQPLEAIDQQYAFSLLVGSEGEKSTHAVDQNLTKVFGDYEVTLKTEGQLEAKKMSLGQQKISFLIKDAKTKQPITNLKPYLGAFGHLVMIHQTRYDYLHVHPYELTPPTPNVNGGPQVDFLPIGIFGPFQSGNYRVFGQFNHDGKIFVVDFTVKVD